MVFNFFSSTYSHFLEVTRGNDDRIVQFCRRFRVRGGRNHRRVDFKVETLVTVRTTKKTTPLK